MNTTGNLTKLVTVFIAGVVIALGGALLYVRGTENGRAQATAAQSVGLPTQGTPQVPPIKTPDLATFGPTHTEPTPVATAPVPLIKERAQPVKSVKRNRTISVANSDHPPIQTPADSGQDANQVAQNQPAQDPATAPPPVNAPVPQNSASLPVPQGKVAVNEPSTYSAPQQPQTVTLQAGTKLNVRLGETVSTATNYEGDTFKATLAEPILINDLVIADKGSRVLGRVTTAERAGRVKGLSELQLTLTEVSTTDGQRIKIQTSPVSKQGSSSKGSDTAKVAGGAALGAIIGAVAGGGKGAAIGAGTGGAAGTGVVLATRGKEASFPVESQLAFQLTSPVTITEQLH